MANTTSEITTLGSVAALIDETLRHCEVDANQIFTRAGIGYSSSNDPDVRIPTQKMFKLWSLAVEATGDPCFGLRVAQQFQPAVLQGLGFAWLASDTLLDALNRLARYSRFINTAVEFHVEEKPDTTDLVVIVPDDMPNYVPAGVDLGMATSLRMCQITAGMSLLPVHLSLQRPEPSCTASFYEMFGPSIDFDAADNRLCFDTDLVNVQLRTANPNLARINDQTVIDYLARFDRASIAMQVRSRIIDQLPDGIPRQEHIAGSLHLSLRSLQRRLREEETSFKDLLENTRHTLARQYLRESHRSIGEITYLLGFSESSNFTRAFKRWTGMTPVEFRNNA
ncbi:MAG: AraC family transcriptional regulator [Gammaproteobacteria bacterium]